MKTSSISWQYSSPARVFMRDYCSHITTHKRADTKTHMDDHIKFADRLRCELSPLWEANFFLQQYPGTKTSDIEVALGMTSRCFHRASEYYTFQYDRHMAWHGGSTSAPGLGIEEKHDTSDFVILASTYPVCGVQSGDDSARSAERCAREVLVDMGFTLHRCVLLEPSRGCTRHRLLPAAEYARRGHRHWQCPGTRCRRSTNNQDMLSRVHLITPRGLQCGNSPLGAHRQGCCMCSMRCDEERSMSVWRRRWVGEAFGRCGLGYVGGTRGGISSK